MKNNNIYRISCILFLSVFIPHCLSQGPYPPAAGESGSTAISKNNNNIQGWASGWMNLQYGQKVTEDWQTPEKAIGQATGSQYDVVSLGQGGRITITFDNPIINGEGFDFAVFENALTDNDLDLAWVEASENGIVFHRFPCYSLTQAPVKSDGVIYPTNIDGVAGKYKQGYGTPFDLDDIGLTHATHIRIVDIVGNGNNFDSDGNAIYDRYPTNGEAGFDLEAIGVLHQAQGTQYTKQVFYITEQGENNLYGYDPALNQSEFIKNLKSEFGYSQLFSFISENENAYLTTNKGIKKINTETLIENFTDLDIWNENDMTIYGNHLLICAPNGILHAYNKHDLSLDYYIQGTDNNGSAITVIDNKAYVAVNGIGGIFPEDPKDEQSGSLYAVNLETKSLQAEYSFPSNIGPVSNLLPYNNSVIGISPATFDWKTGQEVPGSMFVFNTQTNDFRVYENLNFGSSPDRYQNSKVAAVIIDDILYADYKNNIASINLNTGSLIDDDFILAPPSLENEYYKVLKYDEINHKFYALFGNDYAWSNCYIYNSDGSQSFPESIPDIEGPANLIDINYRKNYAPFVVRQIQDRTYLKLPEPDTIDISNVFYDIDNNGSPINYTANSDSRMVSAIIDNSSLILTFFQARAGEATITLNTEIGGESASTQFKVIIQADQPPFVQNPLQDLNLRSNTQFKAISLHNVFSDPDDPDEDIALSIQANSNPSLLDAYIDEELLYLIFEQGQTGNALITIRATSAEQSVDNAFKIEMTENLLPYVNNPIEEIIVNINAPNEFIDLSNVFTDPDDPDEDIEISITSNTNPNLVQTNLDNKNLVLQFKQNNHGQADIQLSAMSGGHTIFYTISVTVLEDKSPIIAYPLPDITVKINSGSREINISNTFIDPDNDDLFIEKSIESVSNPQIVDVSLTKNNIHIDFVKDMFGQCKVIVKAISNGQSVSDEFLITILDDEAPQLKSPIADVNIKENSWGHTIDLTQAFTDPDNDDNEITIELVSVSNEELFGASLRSNFMNIELHPDKNGQAEVTIRANSNGKTTDATFMVIVYPDQPPVVENPIPDTVINKGGEKWIYLYDVFSDPDNNRYEMSYEIADISDKSIINAYAEWDAIRITASKDAIGTALIKIKATSAGKSVEDEFAITVIEDRPPVISRHLPDTLLKEGSWFYIYLPEYFTDPDGDIVYSSIEYQSNPELLIINNWEESIDIQVNKGQLGTDTLVIRGTSNDKFVEDTMIIEVAVDSPPYVLNPVQDVSVKTNSRPVEIDMSNVFADDDDNPEYIWPWIESISNPKLLQIEQWKEKTFVLNFTKDMSGEAEIIVTASSGMYSTTDTFMVYVLPDQPPIVNQKIQDTIVKENHSELRILLADVFTDPDDEDEKIIHTIDNISDETIIDAHIQDKVLHISFLRDMTGPVTLSIRGESNGAFVFDSFIVNIIEDKEPYVSNEIQDVIIKVGSLPLLLNINNVFKDDDDDIEDMILSVSKNSQPELLTAQITSEGLLVEPQGQQTGKVNISVTAESNNKFVHDEFVVDIVPDLPPEASMPFMDTVIRENTRSLVFNLSQVFNDPDDDNSLMTYSIFAINNETLITGEIINDTLLLYPSENMKGKTEVFIKARSNSKSVTDVFDVTIIEDIAPVVVNQIADVDIKENSEPIFIEISNVFTDEDDPDSLFQYSVILDTTEIIGIEINNDSLMISPFDFKTGSTKVSLRGKSHGKGVTEIFYVTVFEDMPPQVLIDIEDINVRENSSPISLDLDMLFTDEDDPDSLIIPSIAINSNPELIQTSLNGETLEINFADFHYGTSKLTLRGTSGKKSIDKILSIDVQFDNPPFVNKEIPDTTIRENSNPLVFKLHEVFDDIDDPNDSIAKIIKYNSNPDLVFAALEENTLTITPVEHAFGEALLTIEAESRGKKSTDVISIVVNEDIPPEFVKELPDTTIKNNSGEYQILCTEYINDPDDPNDEIEFMVISNSNPSFAEVSVTDQKLIINNFEQVTGILELVIQAESRGKHTNDTLEINIVNDEPVVLAKPIDDIAMKSIDIRRSISISGTFHDSDDPDSLILLQILHNSNPDLIFAEIVNDSLIITAETAQTGSGEIILNATSKQSSVSDTFLVSIVEDLPPEIKYPIPDIIVVQNSPNDTLLLTNYFNDSDDDVSIFDFSIEQISQTAFVDVMIKEDELIMNYHENSIGNTQYIVTGKTNNLSISDTFTVHIIEKDSIFVHESIEDISLRENTGSFIIDGIPIFKVNNNDTADIQINIISVSNEDLIQMSIADKKLYVQIQENTFGECIITIEGSYNELSIEEEFKITIIQDMAPEVIQAPEDIVVNENAEDYIINLKNVFVDNDPEDSFEEITISVSENTNEELISTIIDGDKLIISFTNSMHGESNITLLADSRGKSVQTSFHITVNNSSGIHDNENSGHCYPNPFINYLSVESPTGTLISVTDIAGRKIFESHAESDRTIIGSSSWKPGVYLLQLSIGNNMWTSKIIKQ